MNTRRMPAPVPQMVRLEQANSAPRWDLWLVAALAVLGKMFGAPWSN